jgi:hypothetical protein
MEARIRVHLGSEPDSCENDARLFEKHLAPVDMDANGVAHIQLLAGPQELRWRKKIASYRLPDWFQEQIHSLTTAQSP